MMNAVQEMPQGTAAGGWGASSRHIELRELIRRMASGDESAMSVLYDETSTLLYSLALRIAGSREDAEEVVHDVYCRVWRKADSYDESRGSVTSWLVLMTRSIAIDLVRSKRRDSSSVPIETVEFQQESPQLSPEVLASTGETAFRVRQAIATLSAEQRKALELAFYGGLSHSEIAERLSLPLGTVKTRVRSALIKLREMLEGRAL